MCWAECSCCIALEFLECWTGGLVDWLMDNVAYHLMPVSRSEFRSLAIKLHLDERVGDTVM
jgi:hypothetical protein